MNNLKRVELVCFVVIFTFLVNALPLPAVEAAIAPCSVDISSSVLASGAQTALNFSVSNNDTDNNVAFVRILRPSAEYHIVAGSNELWEVNASDDEITFRYGAIEPGGTQVLTVNVITDNTQTSAVNWTVLASDQEDGSDSSSCSGNLATRISNQAVFMVSGVSVQQISQNSAVIRWLTNYAGSSRVFYGKTASYGTSNQAGGNSLTTEHVMTLNNLSPSTTYHFKVQSRTSDNQVAESGDNTFKTLAVPPSTGSGGSNNAAGSGSQTQATTNQVATSFNNLFIKSSPTESTPPTLVIDTVLNGSVLSRAPTIYGSASDNDSVALIEYSIDDGQNWLPVDVANGLGTARAYFSFTPNNLKDGDYGVLVRVTDASRNVALSPAQVFVIDTLPPRIGTHVISVGSQRLLPIKEAVWNVIAGVDHTITLSAVGGPTKIQAEAYLNGQATPSQVFTLTKNNAGLWVGDFSFDSAGAYIIKLRSVDGANNVVETSVGTFAVKSRGKIVDKSSSQPVRASVNIYTRNDDTGAWQLYTPDNDKQEVSSLYGVYLPAGTYYFKFMSDGYAIKNTGIITLDQFGSVSPAIYMSKQKGFVFGWVQAITEPFNQQDIKVDPARDLVKKDSNRTVNLPIFDLPMTNGQNAKTIQYYGYPTVITLVNTWLPSSNEQLMTLGEVQKQYPGVRVLAVAPGESLSKLVAYSRLTSQNQPVAVDTTNELVQQLPSHSGLTHYFIDRRGVVIGYQSGLLSKEDIVNYVSK
jgi:Bacterial Ig-like domain